jgi:hypothetical protein
MSRRSSRSAWRSWTFGEGRDSTCVPLKWLAIWISEFAGNDLDIGARPCHFRPASRWTDQAFVARIGAYRRRQHAGHRRDRTIDPARLQEPTARSSAIPQDADERLDFIFPSVAWATDTPCIAVP